MIEARALEKTFYIHKKEPGLRGSLRSLFVRTKIPKHAVRGVDLTVEPGEIVGMIGPNGAGKTTLIKMLAGIIHPTAGEARVLGHVPWERSNALRSQIALVMGQKAQLWWDLPAADSLLLLKEIYRVPDAAFKQRLDHLSSVLEVTDLLTTQLRRLSLGERMKMELIAALLHGPKVIFLDEPTIGLDLTAQRAIRDFILDYSEREKPAIILTSHYLEDIERLCKRIVIIRDGEFVFDGRLQDVMQRYVRNKTILASFRGTAPDDTHAQLSKLGTVESLDENSVRLCVPRNSVATASAEILQLLDTQDLDIQEEDLGTVVERIFKDREPLR